MKGIGWQTSVAAPQLVGNGLVLMVNGYEWIVNAGEPSGDYAKQQEKEQKEREWDEQTVKARLKERGLWQREHKRNVKALLEMIKLLWDADDKGVNGKRLFSETSMKYDTGYKYMMCLEHLGYVDHRGSRRDGRYMLTEVGKGLILDFRF